MSTQAPPTPAAPAAPRHALPDPGEPVPALALPTVGIFFGGVALFTVSAILAINHDVPRALTIAVDTVVCFVMFTVVHDASHYSISRTRWVNAVLGRLAMLFVSPLTSFVSFAYVHIEHHRHANDDESDPDTFASHGRWWQLPFRLAVLDLGYAPFYLRRVRSRPKAEVAETAAQMLLAIAGLTVAIATGSLWMVAVIYIIPERLAVLLLAWWFDWLSITASPIPSGRIATARRAIGWGWSGC